MRELIAEIPIPLYRRTYISSNKQRVKYYEKGHKKLPLCYCDKFLWDTQKIREAEGTRYIWREFPINRNRIRRMVDFLVDATTNERVVANPAQVGKERISTISGETLIYGGGKHSRNTMLSQIKVQLVQFLMAQKPIQRFPLILELDIFDLLENDPYVKAHTWDVDNRVLPYNKAMLDSLQECNIIPNDSARFITGPPHSLFTPVTNTNDRKLIYRIYVDRRPQILNNPEYQKIHGTKLG